MLLHNRNFHMEILQILMCVFYLLCSVRLYELHVTIYSGDDLCILSTKGGIWYAALLPSSTAHPQYIREFFVQIAHKIYLIACLSGAPLSNMA